VRDFPPLGIPNVHGLIPDSKPYVVVKIIDIWLPWPTTKRGLESDSRKVKFVNPTKGIPPVVLLCQQVSTSIVLAYFSVSTVSMCSLYFFIFLTVQAFVSQVYESLVGFQTGCHTCH
jgi:hypothetical protein